MEDEGFDFEKEYASLKDKYDLPALEGICDDFDIEKAIEKESNYLLRDIRRAMGEKFSVYIHLFENLINPNSPPMFILSAVRNMDTGAKEKVREIYSELSKIQMRALKLDTIYSEKDEAEFIVETFSRWQKMKKEILAIIDTFDEDSVREASNNSRGYFG